jgi:UDP-GlcNAc:undecaprenyl-phosphate GlcNAc-1-phosphate transferase
VNEYVVAFVAALVISAVLTPVVRRFALDHNIMAVPDARKIHLKPVAYLGGLAIFAGFLVPALAFLPLGRRFGALIIGVTILVVMGAIDDIRPLNPWLKLAFQFLAAGVVLGGGIGITDLTNPLGGTVSLAAGRFAVDWGSWHFHVTPIANALSILWLVGLANAVNFLDGLDGLAGGVSAIAAFTMFLLAISPQVNQPEVALLAIILCGSALGFLPFNFYPAKIFMGDSGAYFFGMTLGLIAIYSGAKLATASLVLGFTIFDTLWAVVRRVYHRTSPFKADRGHFHHLLLEAGFSQRRAVLTLYAVALVFGLVAVSSGSFAKLLMLAGLFLLMVTATTALTINAWRRRRNLVG